MSMASFWTLESIKSVLGGTWLARPSEEGSLGGASIDSRAVSAGQIFFALRGERVDGHAFVRGALERGAGLAIVDRPEALEDGLVQEVKSKRAILRVPDVGAALLKLAAAYRKTLDMTKVIAVGGSNGKTTTTRLIEQVLLSGLRGTASIKSFNNAIGVPLTILNARRTDQFLLCEVGTNAPGEILTLTEVVCPDIAVITSIGREHLEGLKDLAGVAQEEATLLRTLNKGGLAILNADAPELTRATQRELAKRIAGTFSVVRFGSASDADLRIGDVRADGNGVRWMVNGRLQCTIGLLGEHNAWNATAALAVGRRLGLNEEQIVSALATAKGPEMRMQKHAVERSGGTITVINDAYNANPESMVKAFEAIGAMSVSPGGRRVLVIGEMLELGIESPALHAEVGKATGLAKPDVVVCVGAMMEHAARVIGQMMPQVQVVRVLSADGEGARQIAGLLRSGDLVLLKGSRRMGLERVLKALEASGGCTSVVEAKPESPLCAERPNAA
ncbi:MAG: UDP-N-acetylmuramoyl-tripeptide--D-alanyl-D-alanine ligase [Planctomycetes bacterium]|nr:UDP-N-acetylmuramoyl-tripeptide--D-alanyl-D-alanine ligase [Planctomycetota bacterium]